MPGDINFEQVFRYSPIGLALVALDGRWLRANPALCRMFGYQEPELIRLSFQDITHPDDLAADLDLLEQVLAGRRDDYQMQKRYQRADGSVFWALLSVSLVHDEGGRPLYFVSQIQDIDHTKQLEHDIRTLEQRWENALQGGQHGVWDWNVQTGETYFSRQWKAMLGYGEDEIPGHIEQWDQLAHPDDVAAVAADLQRHWRGETEIYSNEHRLRHKDGDWRWILDRGRVVSWTSEGKPLRMVGTQTDISHRKATELALLDSNESLMRRALFDALTGLPNRALLEDRVHQAVAAARRTRTHCAVVFVDLDHFKAINDSYGHEAGDAVLREVAERMRDALRETDTVGRLGGDEFVLVLGALGGPAQAEHVLRRLSESLARPVAWAGQALEVGASIGFAMAPQHGEDPDLLISAADSAMYRAKRAGRGGIQAFDPGG